MFAHTIVNRKKEKNYWGMPCVNICAIQNNLANIYQIHKVLPSMLLKVQQYKFPSISFWLNRLCSIVNGRVLSNIFIWLLLSYVGCVKVLGFVWLILSFLIYSYLPLVHKHTSYYDEPKQLWFYVTSCFMLRKLCVAPRNERKE